MSVPSPFSLGRCIFVKESHCFSSGSVVAYSHDPFLQKGYHLWTWTLQSCAGEKESTTGENNWLDCCLFESDENQLQSIRFDQRKKDLSARDFTISRRQVSHLSEKRSDSNLVDSASSIRLSQRLSHASLSINKSILWNCEWLIKLVLIYLVILTIWITVVILELIHAPMPIRAVFIRWKPMRVNPDLGDS